MKYGLIRKYTLLGAETSFNFLVNIYNFLFHILSIYYAFLCKHKHAKHLIKSISYSLILLINNII